VSPSATAALRAASRAPKHPAPNFPLTTPQPTDLKIDVAFGDGGASRRQETEISNLATQ